MLELPKSAAVARFELSEALRSRLVLLLSLVCGLGSFIASAIFLQVLASAEELARETLASQSNVDPETLSVDLIRDNAMPWLASMISDPGTREQVASMDPLSIFFGFATLQTVGAFVLLSSTSSVPRELTSGAVRFALLRCERLTWLAGKAAGQTVLLAAALALAAIAAAAAGVWMEKTIDVERIIWLFRMAFRSWVYGFAHLGLFMGLSMLSRTVMSARAAAVALWVSMSVTHGLLTLGVFTEKAPWLANLAWLFPSHHQSQLWSSDLAPYMLSVLALLGTGLLALYAGSAAFVRRDA